VPTWRCSPPFDAQDLKPRYSQLAEDTEADICVVGGGITGLSIAYSLQKSGVA
jgi:glycerol-3-phosphate dehydrogenase